MSVSHKRGREDDIGIQDPVRRDMTLAEREILEQDMKRLNTALISRDQEATEAIVDEINGKLIQEYYDTYYEIPLQHFKYNTPRYGSHDLRQYMDLHRSIMRSKNSDAIRNERYKNPGLNKKIKIDLLQHDINRLRNKILNKEKDLDFEKRWLVRQQQELSENTPEYIARYCPTLRYDVSKMERDIPFEEKWLNNDKRDLVDMETELHHLKSGDT
jgi:hypothetical protein